MHRQTCPCFMENTYHLHIRGSCVWQWGWRGPAWQLVASAAPPAGEICPLQLCRPHRWARHPTSGGHLHLRPRTLLCAQCISGKKQILWPLKSAEWQLYSYNTKLICFYCAANTIRMKERAVLCENEQLLLPFFEVYRYLDDIWKTNRDSKSFWSCKENLWIVQEQLEEDHNFPWDLPAQASEPPPN